MSPSIPFALPTESPGLILRAELQRDGSRLLFVEQANAPLTQRLLAHGMDKVDNAPLTALCPQNHDIIDEWMEFIVKVYHESGLRPNFSPRGKEISREYLQYFHCVRAWCVSTVTLRTDSAYARVALRLATAAEEAAGPLWQLKGLKQTRRLTNELFRGGAWELDIMTQNIFLSRQIAQALQLAEDAIVVPLSRFLDLARPEDRPTVMSALDNVDTVSSTVFSRGTLQDGSNVCFTSFAVPSYDGSGKMNRILGCSQNITDCTGCTGTSPLADMRMYSIAESSFDLFMTMDGMGRYTYISPNSARILGVAADDFLGKKYGVFQARKEDTRIVRRKINRLLRGGTAGTLVSCIRVADGSARWYSFQITCVLGADGNTAEALILGHDANHEVELQSRIDYLLSFDLLTGVHNRTAFWLEMARLDRTGGEGVCLVLMDVNNLRHVNDAFGYQKGDEMLAEVAELLLRVFPADTFIARSDGSAFAAIICGLPLTAVEELCAALDRACETTSRRMLPLSLSWGIGCYAEGGSSMQGLFNLAESRVSSHKLLIHGSQMISSLKETLKFCNLETSDHMQRMENMVMILGKRLKLPVSEFDRLVLLASLHDIGKVAIPDHIINKPGKLTGEEWAVMRTHSEVGYRIAMASKELSGIAPEISCHHERWDGTGYPGGLSGETIPFLSRIISVVDTYEVMTHKRVYKVPSTHEEAIEELRRCSGSQFDPAVVALFLEVFGSLSVEEMDCFTRGTDAIPPQDDVGGFSL